MNKERATWKIQTLKEILEIKYDIVLNEKVYI